MSVLCRKATLCAAAFAAWGLIAEGRGLVPGQEPPRPLLDAPEPAGDALPPQRENSTLWRGRVVSEPITVKVDGDVRAPEPVMPIRPIHGLPPPQGGR